MSQMGLSEVMHYWHTPPHQSLEETRAPITSLIEGPARAWVLVPRFKETTAIGLIYSLNNSPTPGMRYILSSRYWRNSLMSDAVREIVRFGFEILQLDRIELWIHAVVDAIGLPVHLGLTPGEAHDNRLCSVLLSGLRPRTMLLADRGYDADWIRAFVSEHGAWANIPPKRNRRDAICFSPCLYRARSLVERFFNKIKQCRHIATRYDKLAANYLAFIKLTSIRIWLRVNESAP